MKENIELKNDPHTALYRASQNSVRKYICDELNFQGILYEEYDGNIYKIDQPGPVFVSHMDTVGESDVSVNITAERELNGDLILKRTQPAILGADDKAGISAILNHAGAINFIFTRDEETGYLGAKSLRENKDFLEKVERYAACFVELDRRGQFDSVGVVHGYCQKDLLEDINNTMRESGLDTFGDSHGAFTDIDAFVDLKPGINLSIGYENAHTDKEELNLSYWDKITSMLPALHKALQGDYELPPADTWSYYDEADYWEDHYGSAHSFYCDQCNDFTEKTGELYSVGLVLCDICMINLKEEIEQELRRIEG